jgi:hypothetical protein
MLMSVCSIPSRSLLIFTEFSITHRSKSIFRLKGVSVEMCRCIECLRSLVPRINVTGTGVFRVTGILLVFAPYCRAAIGKNLLNLLVKG